ncbi:MAG: hypothetical protein SV775_00670, partial [Thermodesulfobacteriota bacterium]|nr:hypothetical protein [Thermodesulfobacteriota bacterium]
MIKKSAFIFAFTFLLAGFICPVNAEKVSIEKDVLDKILKRQEVLEKKIRKLEMKSEKAAPGAPGKDIDYLKEDVADISERLDKVETKSILDRIT